MDINDKVRNVTGIILDDYTKGRDVDQMDVFNQPDTQEISSLIRKLLNIIFPGYYRLREFRSYNDNNRISILIEDIIYNLKKQVAIALAFRDDCKNVSKDRRLDLAEDLVIDFLKRIPDVRAKVNTDLQAFYDGDPAAEFKEEVVLSYPGLLAITVNRLAHELFLLKIPLIPRMMTEYAHSCTGIDIHPGAVIGDYFFMDHGTGIVVGETSVIGRNVKIYQGVTIGALSTRGGQRLRGVKRHPTIEDNVTIYSGASILGGETVIGAGSVIGSNAFITSSVPPNSRISIKNRDIITVKSSDGYDKEKNDELNGDAWFYVI